MRPEKNEDGSASDGDPPSVSLEVSGANQQNRRGWTLGDSSQLGNGPPGEPLLVTLGWIFIPILMFLALISFFAV